MQIRECCQAFDECELVKRLIEDRHAVFWVCDYFELADGLTQKQYDFLRDCFRHVRDASAAEQRPRIVI